MIQKLYRKSQGAVISGVLNGIADSYALDPTFIRIVFSGFCVLTAFVPLMLVYLALAVILPVNPTPRNYYRRFKRCYKQKVIGGVLSGIARYFRWNVMAVRVVYILLAVISQFFPLFILYVAFCVLTPFSFGAEDDEIEIS